MLNMVTDTAMSLRLNSKLKSLAQYFISENALNDLICLNILSIYLWRNSCITAGVFRKHFLDNKTNYMSRRRKE